MNATPESHTSRLTPGTTPHDEPEQPELCKSRTELRCVTFGGSAVRVGKLLTKTLIPSL